MAQKRPKRLTNPGRNTGSSPLGAELRRDWQMCRRNAAIGRWLLSGRGRLAGRYGSLVFFTSVDEQVIYCAQVVVLVFKHALKTKQRSKMHPHSTCH